jgi:hypothetical protein
VATICGVWIVAALFAVPSAVSKYLYFVLHSSTNETYYKRVVIFELVVACALPLCVIAFTYIKTARHLLEGSISISEGTQNPQLNIRRSTAKVVVGLTVVFMISYLPYHVFWAYIICTEEGLYYFEKYGNPFFLSSHITDMNLLSVDKLQYMYLISTCLLLINCSLNPVALFCTSSPFRQHLIRYLTWFCKINSPPSGLELSSRN